MGDDQQHIKKGDEMHNELRVHTDGENIIKMVLPKKPMQDGISWSKADIAALAERIESYWCTQVQYVEADRQYIFYTPVQCSIQQNNLDETIDDCVGFARAIESFGVDVGWEIDHLAAQFLQLKKKILIRQKEISDDIADAKKLVRFDERVAEICEAGSRHETVANAERKIKQLNCELKAVNAAISRIINNRYGLCVSCGEPIAIKRLTLLPTTPVCFDCAD